MNLVALFPSETSHSVECIWLPSSNSCHFLASISWLKLRRQTTNQSATFIAFTVRGRNSLLRVSTKRWFSWTHLQCTFLFLRPTCARYLTLNIERSLPETGCCGLSQGSESFRRALHAMPGEHSWGHGRECCTRAQHKQCPATPMQHVSQTHTGHAHEYANCIHECEM